MPDTSNAGEPGEGTARSSLFLVFCYREEANGERGWLDGFEDRLRQGSLWRRESPDADGLLPHLDSIRSGGVFRAFQAAGKLPNFFSGGTTWSLFDLSARGEEKNRLYVRFPRSPRLFAFESGYVFVALEVLPAEDTLLSHLDLAGKLVRGDFAHLTSTALPEKARK